MFSITKNINLIANGDQKKFSQLIDFFADDLLFFAIGFLRNKEVAEEIVSDVFVKIWSNRTELNKVKNLKSYLFISVKNGCLSYLRKKKNKKIISIDQFDDFYFLPVEGPENELIRKEDIKNIYDAIKKLPPKTKLAFSLAKIHNFKYKEIAEIMGISEKTVNNHLVAAVKKIRLSLGIKSRSNTSKSYLNRASLFSF